MLRDRHLKPGSTGVLSPAALLCLLTLTAGALVLSARLTEVRPPQALAGEPDWAGGRWLLPERPVEAQVSRRGARTFRLFLRAGQFVEIVVDELAGTDVSLFFWDPLGRPLPEIDTPSIGDDRSEVLVTVARRDGVYRLVVVPLTERTLGSYRVLWKVSRIATPRDRLEAAAHESFSRGENLRRLRTGNGWRAALPQYRKALCIWTSQRDGIWRDKALHRIGWIYELLDRPAEAYAVRCRLLAAWRGTPKERLLLNEIGGIKERQRDFESASYLFTESARLSHQAGDPRLEAASRNNLGLLFHHRGWFQRSWDSYHFALALHPEQDLEHALYLANFCELQMDLGAYTEALANCRQALAIQEAGGGPSEMIVTLRTLGLVHLGLGSRAAALGALRRGEELARQRGESWKLMNILNALGNVHLEAMRYEDARRAHKDALDIGKRLEDKVGVAHACGNLGHLADVAGDHQEAVRLFAQAIGIYRDLRDPTSEVQALLGMALALSNMNRLGEANDQLARATNLIESLRFEPASSDLRARFFASRQRSYEDYIDLLMQQHGSQGTRGYDRLAFDVSERTRSRTLLEDMASLRVVPAAAELLSQGGRSGEPLVLAKGPEGEEAREGGAVRQGNPRLAALVRPLTLEEIQQSLLDDSTFILAFKLGHRKSYRWLIGRDFVESHGLPSRFEIERSLQETLGLLVRSHEIPVRSKAVASARRLSQMLLGGIVRPLRGKRLLIIPDGSLHRLPFGVLPDLQDETFPGDGSRRWWPATLLEHHEIAYVPAASVLVLIRQEAASRPAPPQTLVVLAPEIAARDEVGLASRAVSSLLLPVGSSGSALESLPPLPFAAEEAQAIQRWVPAGLRHVALGKAVDRELFARLGQYRIVHFAGHALIEPEAAWESGLVLWHADRAGRPRRGVLTVREIHRLRLPVDLVVLSACGTGLGSEIPGEGPVGLTRAFLYAGASRVVVSLWNVRDRATRDLMARFYERMLGERQAPAAALRQAQLAMLSEPARQAPYYWGGFVMEGEWR